MKKFLDLQGLTHLVEKIKGLLNNKVDKVDGKVLSSNDFTTTEKNKLNGISTGAQANKIETIKVNNTPLTITSKAVNIDVPTTDEIETQITSKGYQTASQVNTAITSKGYQTASQVSTAISTAIAGVTQFEQQVVEALPSTGVKGTIYLVSNSGTENNVYDEYIYVNSKWEKIGTTEIDLSGYIKDSDLAELTNEEIDAIFN